MTLKACLDCGASFDVSQFCKNRARPDGINPRCRACMSARWKLHYAGNRGKLIARATESTRRRRERPEVREAERLASREAKRRQLSDPVEYEKHLARGRKWCAENKERVKKFKHMGKPFRAARTMKRYADERNATPSWANLADIAKVYEFAAKLSQACGVAYQVDHMAPLSGKTACGLHVPWNMQVIPANMNRSKGSKVIPDLAGAAYFNIAA